MTLQKIVVIVLSLTGAGTLIGAVIGWILGVETPSLYYALFDNRDINPVQVGVGIGVANGSLMGFVLGIVAVLCLCSGKRNNP